MTRIITQRIKDSLDAEEISDSRLKQQIQTVEDRDEEETSIHVEG